MSPLLPAASSACPRSTLGANPRRFFYRPRQISPRDQARPHGRNHCVPLAAGRALEAAAPMMAVPEAFKTAPRLPPVSRADNVCACGSAMYKTYVVVASGDGRRRRQVKTPVLWCRRCLRPGMSVGLKGQTEVRNAGFYWSCEHCGKIMHRLLIGRGNVTGVPIPLSYCVECVSVSFRDIIADGGTRTCDMCGTAVPVRNRWCAGCLVIAERWRKGHGVIPPSDDRSFAEVIRRVKAEARRLGWSCMPGMRVCRSCRREFAPPGGSRHRRCASCIDASLRERQGRASMAQRRRRERERRERMAGMVEAGRGAGGLEVDAAAPVARGVGPMDMLAAATAAREVVAAA